ncbi:MAG: WbqC family protein [Bacteroidales bacterium]|nr:WbqC family protein [Bacteroidales bacterium]
MKLAIMQPYFMPYIGYFQTMAAVDTYVVYDDVQYIKGGWVGHNYLLIGGKKQMFTIQLKGASPNKLFNEVEIGDSFKKLTHMLQLNYRKAPFYDEVMPVLQDIFSYEDRNLARFLWNSYRKLFEYLEIDTNIILSSSIEKDNSLRGKDKVLAICKTLGADTYLNAIGGQELYDKVEFAANGVDLHFVKTDDFDYQQFVSDFEPGLSFIDVLMFNGKEGTRKLLRKYTLV